MKKVGLLIPNLSSGGAEAVVSRLSKILKETYDIYIILFDSQNICYEFSGNLIDMNINVKGTSIIKKLPLTLKRILKLRKIKKEENFDAVISFLDNANIVNVLSKTRTCKSILSIRNYIKIEMSKSFLGKIINFCIKVLYNRADYIITVSKLIEQSMNKDYQIKCSKLSTIYNPYNVDEICEKSIELIEDQYKDFFKSKKIFITVGRQSHQKGYWHLLKAFFLVKKNIPDAKLIIIGKDFLDGKVKKLAEKLNIKDDILFITYHNNPFKFIANSQVYIMTSLFEGFPNALVEAMICRCPVIATDCKSGPREILYHELDLNKSISNIETAEYGILVPAFNNNENWNSNDFEKGDMILSSAMFELMENMELRNNYTDKAFERAKKFNYEICNSKYMEVIEFVE